MGIETRDRGRESGGYSVALPREGWEGVWIARGWPARPPSPCCPLLRPRAGSPWLNPHIAGLTCEALASPAPSRADELSNAVLACCGPPPLLPSRHDQGSVRLRYPPPAGLFPLSKGASARQSGDLRNGKGKHFVSLPA